MIRSFLNYRVLGTRGAAAIEYSLLISLLGVASIASLSSVEDGISSTFYRFQLAVAGDHDSYRIGSDGEFPGSSGAYGGGTDTSHPGGSEDCAETPGGCTVGDPDSGAEETSD